jgi:cell division protein FtsZ
MDFDMIETEIQDGTIIKVVGVGGAGGNAVQHMISRGVQGVEFICMNTDAQALKRSTASRVLQLATPAWAPAPSRKWPQLRGAGA